MEILTNPAPTAFTWLRALFLIGLGIFFRQPVMSGICFTLAALPFFTAKGVAFDIPNRRYRHFSKIGGLRIGRWEQLPSVSRVVAKYFSQLGTSGKPGRMRTDREEYLVVMLSVEGSATGIIVERLALEAKSEALELAEDLARPLGIPEVYVPLQEAAHGVSV
ncbi:hypothetical protein [Hymenobacter koreensis]|uniref:Uncharacterized protein n=1 Tax=Hymenobacter koreensis TaxID=1084523 RepID=A0ABP8J3X6_9BACT